MLTYIIAALVIMFVIVLGCVLSLTVNTTRIFKKYRRPEKRSRGAAISSPRLHDAIFAINEKYIPPWKTEEEAEPDTSC